MNFNNTCIRCEIVFNKVVDLKNSEYSNEHLEPLDLNYRDTLICRKCLEKLYQEKLISELRWERSKFNKLKNNDKYQMYSLY